MSWLTRGPSKWRASRSPSSACWYPCLFSATSGKPADLLRVGLVVCWSDKTRERKRPHNIWLKSQKRPTDHCTVVFHSFYKSHLNNQVINGSNSVITGEKWKVFPLSEKKSRLTREKDHIITQCFFSPPTTHYCVVHDREYIQLLDQCFTSCIFLPAEVYAVRGQPFTSIYSQPSPSWPSARPLKSPTSTSQATSAPPALQAKSGVYARRYENPHLKMYKVINNCALSS